MQASQLQKIQFDDYNQYIDPSDELINIYQKKSAKDSEHYSGLIDTWCLRQIKQKEDNKPLVVCNEKKGGQEIQLVNWEQYHYENNNKGQQDIIIHHFSSAGESNRSLYFAMYRILIKLREALNIEQKIEVQNEPLRNYFGYWLNIACQQIKNQMIHDQLIIIVIHDIDILKDPFENQTHIGYWLPRVLPELVRVIVSCDNKQSAAQYLKEIKSEFIYLQLNEVPEFALQNHMMTQESEYKSKILEIYKNIPDYLKESLEYCQTFLELFDPCCSLEDNDKEYVQKKLNEHFSQIDLSQLKKITNTQDLIQLSLIINSKIFEADKFKQLVQILSISDKGLSIQELKDLVKIKSKDWKLFYSIYKYMIADYKNLKLIHNHNFIQAINSVFPQTKDQIKENHNLIAQRLEITNFGMRKLEEITNYFKLKEFLTDIESFQILFNGINKYHFYNYWGTLLEKGFDPVNEYNKSLGGFLMHYHPPQECEFLIILQISRFLKEFSDFETFQTPQFRHPPIKGIQLAQIGLLKEFKKLDLYYENDIQIITDDESLNMDIPSNRELFKQKIHVELNQILKSNEQQLEENNIDDNLSDSITLTIDSKLSSHFSVDKKPIKIKIEKMSYEQQMQLAQLKNPSKFYFYKRWIWIMFPLISVNPSTNCDYSEQIAKCYTGNTKYMTVLQEQLYRCKVMKGCLEAVLTKKLMYTSKEDLQDQLESLSKIKSNLKVYQQEQNNYEALNAIPNEPNFFAPPAEKTILKMQSAIKAKPALKNEQQVSQSVVFEKKVSRYQNNQNQNSGGFFLTSDPNEMGQSMNIIENTKFKNMKKLFQVSSQSLLKLDTSNNLSKSIGSKSQMKLFQINSSIVSQKQMKEGSYLCLPKINSQINIHTTQQLSGMEKHNKSLKQQYDSLLYENKNLQKNLKLQNIIYQNQLLALDASEIYQLHKKTQELEDMIQLDENKVEQSKSHIERLNLVIQVLKTNNSAICEEWIGDLNYLHENYIKLTEFETKSLYVNEKQIQEYAKINNQLQIVNSEQQYNRFNLIKMIKNKFQTKQKIDEKYAQNEQINSASGSFMNDDNLKSKKKAERLASQQRIKDEIIQQERWLLADQMKVQLQDLSKLVGEDMTKIEFDISKIKYKNDQTANYQSNIMGQKEKLQQLKKKQQKLSYQLNLQQKIQDYKAKHIETHRNEEDENNSKLQNESLQRQLQLKDLALEFMAIEKKELRKNQITALFSLTSLHKLFDQNSIDVLSLKKINFQKIQMNIQEKLNDIQQKQPELLQRQFESRNNSLSDQSLQINKDQQSQIYQEENQNILTKDE